MIALEVRGLGAAEIRVATTRITLSQERVFKTLFYLAIRAGERVPRTDLVETLWGGEAPSRGRQSLRQMLYRLRLMGLQLDESGEEVRLDPTRLRCDVTDALRDEWVSTASADQVWAAAELLPGMGQQTTPAFEEWLEALRARVSSQFRRAALRHVADARRSARWRDVEELALRVLYSDPLNEEATLARAEALAMQGSKSMALDVLDAYAAELGERADRIGLPAALLRKRISNRAKAQPADDTHAERTAGPYDREEILTDLFPFSRNSVEADGQVYAITGAGGVGKTRVAKELAHVADLNGIVVIECRVESKHGAAPYSLFRNLAEKLISYPGSAGAAPSALASLRRLTTTHNIPNVAPSPALTSSEEQSIAGAMQEVLSSVSEEQRLIIWIEDFHNVDTASQALVAAVMNQCSAIRTRWLITSRDRAQSIRHQLSSVLSDRFAIRMLRPLGLRAGASYAMDIAALSGRHLTEDTASAIARQAGGNPLFIRLLTEARSAHSHSASPDGSLDTLLARHLETLDPLSLSVLHGVALLRSEATPLRLRDAGELSHKSLLNTLQRLEHAGMLEIGPTGALTLHECWRTALDKALEGAERVALSLQYAEYIEQHLTDTGVTAIWHAAVLYREAGENRRSFPLFLKAGRTLYAQGLADGALEAFSAALDCSRESHQQRLVHLDIARCHHATGAMEAAHNAATTGLALRCDGSRESVDARLYLQSMQLDARWRLGEPHAPLASDIIHGLSDSRASRDARGFSAFTCVRILFNDSSLEQDAHLINRATTAAALLGNNEFALLARLVVAAERGTAEDVIQLSDSLGLLSREGVPVSVQATTLRYRAQALRWSGHYEAALDLTALCFRLCSSVGLREEAALLALQSGFLCLDLDMLDEARDWHTKCVGQNGSTSTHERRIALAHLNSRILLASGLLEEAAAVLSPLREEIATDQLARRRCAGAASLALAMTGVNDITECLKLIETATSVLETETPSLQLDFPCEAVARALIAIDRPEEAESAILKYLQRRIRYFPRPLAPAFTLLRQAASSTVSGR